MFLMLNEKFVQGLSKLKKPITKSPTKLNCGRLRKVLKTLNEVAFQCKFINKQIETVDEAASLGKLKQRRQLKYRFPVLKLKKMS